MTIIPRHLIYTEASIVGIKLSANTQVSVSNLILVRL